MDDRMRAYIALEHALRAGDLAAARAALGSPPDWPDVKEPYTNTPVIALAIHWAPLEAVARLLGDGADPNVEVLDGFPSVLSAVMSERSDALELTILLLDYDADPNTRGINGWTPLHVAAGRDDVRLIQLLVDHGADPTIRTDVDDYETPRELAQRCDRHAAAALLEALED